MSMNPLTGKAGTNHVTSGDMGAMQAAVFGAGNYLLPTADGSFPNVVMKDSNTISVPVMNMVLEGRFARVTAAETVKVSSGVTGKKRNDLLCIKYSRDGQNIESISFVVLSGASVESNPSDPTVPAGSILGGASTAYVPVARIPIDGINVGKPVMLLSRRGSLWDSVSQSGDWQIVWRPRGYDAYRVTKMTLSPSTNTAQDVPLPIRAAKWDAYQVDMQLMNDDKDKVPNFDSISLISNRCSETGFQIVAWNAANVRLSYRIAIALHVFDV